MSAQDSDAGEFELIRRYFLRGADASGVILGIGDDGALLALTLPRADAAWLEGFSAGLFELAQAHGVALVGGDTTRGPLTVSVQILGHVPRGAALRRSGARPGDLLAVSGTLGDAAAGLALLESPPPRARGGEADELIRRFDYPDPR